MYYIHVQHMRFNGRLSSGYHKQAPGSSASEALDHVERYLKRGFIGLISTNGVQRQVSK